MGLFSFIKDAGENLFGGKAEAAEERAREIQDQFNKYNVDGVTVSVDDSKVTLTGEVMNKIVRRKAITIAGNVRGIDEVDDQLSYTNNDPNTGIINPAEQTSDSEDEDLAQEFYTVKSGDTLSGIAKEQYGDAMKYPEIFEANKPMLSDPDKIYPGQKLIIPKL